MRVFTDRSALLEAWFACNGDAAWLRRLAVVVLQQPADLVLTLYDGQPPDRRTAVGSSTRRVEYESTPASTSTFLCGRNSASR